MSVLLSQPVDTAQDNSLGRHGIRLRSHTCSALGDKVERPRNLGLRSVTVSTISFCGEIPSNIAFHQLKRSAKKLKIVPSIEISNQEDEQSFILSPTKNGGEATPGHLDIPESGEKDIDDGNEEDCSEEDESGDSSDSDSYSDGDSVGSDGDSSEDDNNDEIGSNDVFVDRRQDIFKRKRLACVSSISSEGSCNDRIKGRSDSFNCSFRWSVA